MLDTMVKDLEEATAAEKEAVANYEELSAAKNKEYELVKKTRAEELLALADTIKILNDDDALDLFKKTLPSPSLLQMRVSAKEVRQRALRALRGGRKSKDSRLDLISLAIRGKKVSFEKVLTMIDEMVALLGKEQEDDDKKKAYCESEIDSAEDEIKTLKGHIGDLDAAIEEN